VKSTTQKLTITVCGFVLLFAGALTAAAAGKSATFTGEISDSMCGAKHQMADKAACTRACVGKGSKYALVSGDKVYTLDTSDKAVLAKLNSLAGEKAKVSGTASGDTIEVSKVAAAK
jgi:type 1 fimbria pilin